LIPTGLLLFACAAGCAGSRTTASNGVPSLRIVGSDTMHPLVQRWAEEFMRSHPRRIIEAEGGGTGRGIQALIEGRADLSAASRTMLPEEVRQLLDRRGFLGMNVLTGKDALSIYVHPDNPVQNLDLEELAGIFSGRVRNWAEVGGDSLDILVVGRQPNSGTFFFFRERVLRGAPYATGTRTVPNTRTVTLEVARNRAAIGYGGMAYGRDVVHCSVNGVAPTHDNVRNGSYPLSRYLYLYTSGPLQGLVQEFVDWVLSEAGQRLVREVGYIPLWDLED
jgi:phosphate transport system substrate-binding protein